MRMKSILVAAAISAFACATLATGPAAGSEMAAQGREASAGRDPAPTFVDDVLIPEDGLARSYSLATTSTGERPTYDVVFFRIDTATRQSGLTSASAQELTERAHAWWAEATNEAAPVLRRRGMKTVTSPQESVCGLDEAEDAVGLDELYGLKPSEGADDVLYVLVSPDTGCASAGVAWLGLSGLWVAYDDRPDRLLAVTLHEMGHNFGLEHSGAPLDDVGRNTWVGDGKDRVFAYGDFSDIMSTTWYRNNSPVGPWTATSGLHGLHRQMLGGIDDSEIDHVDAGESRTLTLAASNSDTADGVKLVYVPSFNRAKYVLEYRAATGLDEYLDGGPRSGVLVRLNNYEPNAGPTNYDPAGVGTFVWRAGGNLRQPFFGFTIGQTTALPDGTQIAVNGIESGIATVTVTRPTDSTPPVFVDEPHLDYCYDFTWPVGVCEEWANSRGVWSGTMYWPVISDETWAESITLEVNGQPTRERVSPASGVDGSRSGFTEGSGSGWGFAVTLPTGVHTLEFVARDASGNESRIGTRLTVKADDETPVAPRPGLIRGVKVDARGKVAVITWKAPPAKWHVTSYEWRLFTPGTSPRWRTVKNGSARQLRVPLPRGGAWSSMDLRAVSAGGPGPEVFIRLPPRR